MRGFSICAYYLKGICDSSAGRCDAQPSTCPRPYAVRAVCRPIRRSSPRAPAAARCPGSGECKNALVDAAGIPPSRDWKHSALSYGVNTARCKTGRQTHPFSYSGHNIPVIEKIPAILSQENRGNFSINRRSRRSPDSCPPARRCPQRFRRFRTAR
jgi:hypothetical protein